MRTTRTGQQRITVDDLGDLDAMIVTIDGARIQNFSGNYLDDSGDKKVVLTFKEFGDAEYVLNGTSFHALADRYGNDKDNGFRGWIGKPCVLVREETTDPRGGEKIQAVWVARPHQWAEALRAYAPERKAPAKKAAGKKAAPAKRAGR